MIKEDMKGGVVNQSNCPGGCSALGSVGQEMVEKTRKEGDSAKKICLHKRDGGKRQRLLFFIQSLG